MRRIGLTLSVVALLALLGAACRPVAAPGVEPWNPTGNLESVVGGSGEVRIIGWASQWDLFVNDAVRDQGPVQIVVMVDGQWLKGTFPADNPRADVHWALGTSQLYQVMQEGMGYGFDFTVPAQPGEVTVCVVALNQNLDVLPFMAEAGDHVLLGCRTVTVS
jgi:hypothetical protein